MSKFFDYGDDEPAYYHIKARDMSIYKPKGKVMTFVTPVLLAGGSGTRLWPLSRKTYPKQFSNY